MAALTIKVKRLSHAEGIPLPQYMSKGASGCDLYAAVSEPVTVLPNEIKLIPTGLCVQIPEGFEAQIRPRSGLALKNGISLVNTPGTIDSDYRGEIKLIMVNFGPQPFTIQKGDRIAQIVFQKVEKVQWELVEELEDSHRHDGGFGHTGK